MDSVISLVNRMSNWFYTNSYHIFTSAFSVGVFLFVAQKLMEKCCRFQFKTSDHPDHLIIVQHGFWGKLHSF